MGYKLETTALNYKDNYNAFRIRCIMLILENLKDCNKKFKDQKLYPLTFLFLQKIWYFHLENEEI